LPRVTCFLGDIIMRSATLWLLGLSSWFALTAVAPAAVVELRPQAVAVVNAVDFSPVDAELIVAPGKLLPRDEPYLIQVDVSMRIYDLQPEQLGFSNTAFSVEISGDGTAYSDLSNGVLAWTTNDILVCTNGIPPSCTLNAIWELNSDDGPDKNDLQSITLSGITKSFGPPANDPRRTLGQDEDGEYAGSFYIVLPGTPGATASAETLTPWGASTYDAEGNSSTANNTAIGGLTTTFTVVPEPSTLGLAVSLLAAAGILWRRRSKTPRRLAAIGLTALFPLTVHAAEVEIKPLASAVLNPDFTLVDPAMIRPDGRLVPREDYYLIQVDVSMRIYDLQPGQEGFSNTAFNVAVHGDGTAYSDIDLGLMKWQPAQDLVDFNGCVFCPYNLWDINADAGPDVNDLQAVLLSVWTKNFGPAPFDPRRTLGQDEDGEYAGSFFVQLPGTPGATAYAETLTPWGASTFDSTGLASTAGNSAIGGLTTTFTVVPEPSSALLLLIAAGGLGYCRRLIPAR
jgi:hypothetical protein